MIGKKLINTGVAEADTNLPSGYFNTVLYEGNGGTQRIGGYINRGAVFNGSGSYIDLPNSVTSAFNTSSNGFAISFFWFNSTLSGQIIPFYFSNGVIIGIDKEPNNNLRVLFTSGSGNITFNVTNNLTTNTWQHIVVTGDSTNGLKMYIDESEVGSNSWDGTHSNGTGSNRIGHSTVSGTGRIDQFRIFNKALSSGEVTTLYGETHASTTIATTDIFNDNSGVALYQLDGNANDTGGASGKFGSAAIFNGSSSKIVLPTSTFSPSTFTLSAWCNVVSDTDENTILELFDNQTYPNHTTIVFSAGGSANSSRFLLRNYTTNEYNYNPSGSVAKNVWKHYAMTYDGSTVKSYIDGSLVDSGSLTLSNTVGTISSIQLGLSSGTRYLNGSIDQVRIYSSALSSSDVTNLYNESSVPTANLVAHYKLDGDARDEQQLYDGTASNVTYAYDGTATNVTYQEATNFSPDLVWIKERTSTSGHHLGDSVRGATKMIYSNLTNAESTDTATITSFDSNGFTVGSSGGVNQSSQDYVSWCFNAGGSSDTFNIDGTGYSSASAAGLDGGTLAESKILGISTNTKAGFSIIQYDASSGVSGGQTIETGLTSDIELMIVKRTDSTGVWLTVDSISNKYHILNSTAAGVNITYTDYVDGTKIKVYDLATFVHYCFHSVDGIQKVGSYTSDGSDGDVFVETNFEPAFLMIKNAGSAHDWVIFDNKRDTANLRDSKLSPNTSGAEYSATSIGVDFTSDGFVIRGTDDAINDATDTFIYLAIAADPDTTTPTVENSFDVVTYTGNGGTQSIDVDFKPDLVWIKNRDIVVDHALIDSVRGAAEVLRSNQTTAETTRSDSLTSFDSNGFTLGSDGVWWTNKSGDDYVAWCWKAGDHDDNLPQINTEGSIDSVVSVNDAAGFSIVKYTAGGTATVGHGLSQAPELIITKNLDASEQWFVYAEPVGTQKFLGLNTSSAATSNSGVYTSIGSSTFTNNISSTSRTYINYCFTSITGYQKIGSYSGTGATTNKITTGFKPRFLLVKQTNTTRNWYIIDSTRNPSDPRNLLLIPNDSATEFAGSGDVYCDFLSDGFEWTSSAGDAVNQSGGTYIYLAIA